MIIDSFCPADVSLEGGGQISYGSNNVNGLDNPLFCNISTSNYTLAGNSPCLGSGQMGEHWRIDIDFGNVLKIIMCHSMLRKMATAV